MNEPKIGLGGFPICRGGPSGDILRHHLVLAKKWKKDGYKVKASDFNTIWTRLSNSELYKGVTFLKGKTLAQVEEFVLQMCGLAITAGVKAIHLSRADYSLITEERPVFENGEDIIINHVHLNGLWGVIKTPVHMDDRVCFWCFALDAIDKCSRCKESRYCGPECQKAHWPDHKRVCKK